MKKAGIIILIAGLLITVFTGLDFVTINRAGAIGKFGISINHSLSWSPVIGSIMMVFGVAIYLLGITQSQYRSTSDSIIYK
jgi:hypothetical protein